jgi:hypothetical protein
VVRQPQRLLRRRLHRPAGAAAARADTDINAYTYPDPNSYRDCNCDGHCNCYGNSYSYSYPHSYCDSCAQVDADTAAASVPEASPVELDKKLALIINT